MSKKRKTKYREYVTHPRYGDKPIYSGATFPVEKILRAHWQYKADSIFPETAIEADISKQNYSTYPICIYVDIEKKCVQCQRWFIFYAQEQKYWLEYLGFYVDADCTKCIDCRKKEQSIKFLIHEYEVLVKKSNRTEPETSKLKNIALELFQLGYIKNQNKLNGIS
ncbi:zinc-ribbon domain containing protein [Zooshikella sp. RANM57]|uniref:zinc-ribbon domain containing protein n=1 Tax=Zooshikella sp. RANM57 TaxID=3425863 RepID=UPI003D6F9027